MTKQNKVLEALENVRKRIETEVVTIKRSDEELVYYDALGVNKVLREEINKAVEEGEKELKLMEVALEKIRPTNRKHGSRKRKKVKRLSKDQLFDEKMSYR